MRILWIFVVLAVIVLIPFVFWGDWFAALFTDEGAVEWLRSYGAWAWAAGLALLLLDLVLPLPSTVIMSALGYVYGPLWGGLLAGAGSFLAGAAGYVLCRLGGRRAACFIAGEKGMQENNELFFRVGGWLVALSRCLPLLPEVIACMAGLARMPAAKFFTSLACGAIPVGFVFATIGSTGANHPVAAILLSLALPVGFWLLARHLLRRYSHGSHRGRE